MISTKLAMPTNDCTTSGVPTFMTVSQVDHIFIPFHLQIYQVIAQWANQEQSHHHPFYSVWQKWIKKGLLDNSKYPRVCTIMGLQ